MNTKFTHDSSGQSLRRLFLIVLSILVLFVAAIIAVPHIMSPPPFSGLAFPSEEAFLNALNLDCSGMFPSTEYTEDQANDYLQNRDIRYPFKHYQPDSVSAEMELAYIEVHDDYILYAYAYDYDARSDPYLKQASPNRRILMYWMRDAKYGNAYLRTDSKGTYTLERLRFFIPNEQQDDRQIIWRETADSWFVGRFPQSLPLEQALDLCVMEEVEAPVPHKRGDGGLVFMTDLVSWSDWSRGPICRAQVELPVTGYQQPGAPLIVDDDLNIWYDDGYTHIYRYNLQTGTANTAWTAPEDARISLCYADRSYVVWTEHRRLTSNQEEAYQVSVLDRKSEEVRTFALPLSRPDPTTRRYGDLLYFVFDPVTNGPYDYTDVLMAYNLETGSLTQIAEGAISLYNYAGQLYWNNRTDQGNLIWYTVRDGQAVSLSEQERIESDLPYLEMDEYENELGRQATALMMHQGSRSDILAYIDRYAHRIDFCTGWSIRGNIYAPAMVIRSKDIPLVPLFYDLDQHIFVELDTSPLSGFTENWIPSEYSSGASWYMTVQTESHIVFYSEYRSQYEPYKLELVWIDREDLP